MERNYKKICISCKKLKKSSSFGKDKYTKSGLSPSCKDCNKKSCKKWNEKNKEKIHEYSINYYKKTKEKMKESTHVYYKENRKKIIKYSQKYNLQKVYNLTEKEYEQMFIIQDFKCSICGREQDLKWKRRLAIDHDHLTGKIRGLLCHHCNMGLGQFFDDPFLLRKALKYLLKHKEK
jgi:hypothetical protein